MTDVLTLLEFQRRTALAAGNHELADVLDRACGEIILMRGKIAPDGFVLVPRGSSRNEVIEMCLAEIEQAERDYLSVDQAFAAIPGRLRSLKDGQ